MGPQIPDRTRETSLDGPCAHMDASCGAQGANSCRQRQSARGQGAVKAAPESAPAILRAVRKRARSGAVQNLTTGSTNKVGGVRTSVRIPSGSPAVMPQSRWGLPSRKPALKSWFKRRPVWLDQKFPQKTFFDLPTSERRLRGLNRSGERQTKAKPRRGSRRFS